MQQPPQNTTTNAPINTNQFYYVSVSRELSPQTEPLTDDKAADILALVESKLTSITFQFRTLDQPARMLWFCRWC
jgi:hypothetical protein